MITGEMRIRQFGLISLVLLLCAGTMPTARAETTAITQPTTLLISQAQFGGAGSGHAGDEFVELYNSSNIPLAVDGWSLQYRSATAPGDCSASWTTKGYLPRSVIPSGGSFLIAATGYLIQADARFAPGLAATKGALRLLDETSTSVDTLAWGGAPCGVGTASISPLDGQSLERKLGTTSPLGNSENTLNNGQDFVVRANPKPRSLRTRPDITSYAPLTLSEILTDPSEDIKPFIELHNDSDIPVQTSAYGIILGTTLAHLKPAIAPANGYVVFDLTALGLAITPTGDQLTLLDPGGRAIDRSNSWTTLSTGTSWSLLDTGWAATTSITPGEVNSATVAPLAPTVGAPVIPTTVPIEISELLPQPSEADLVQATKFVELHNTSSQIVTLDGYMLRSGPSGGNKVLLPSLTFLPGAYLSLPFITVPLPLAASGGRVALYDSSGAIVGTPVTYGKAALGLAYAHFITGWQWTTLATPGAVNILVAPLGSSAAKSVATAKQKAAATSDMSKKTTATKANKKTVAKVVKTAKTSPIVLQTAKTAATTSLPWLLFVLAGLTMAYITYEFRHDLIHYYQLRLRNNRFWRTRRTSPPGRRDPRTPE